MKQLLLILILLATLSNYNIAFAQQTESGLTELRGKASITIDVSHMQDTSGRFMLMIGGELFFPLIQNDILVLDKILDEPRRSFLAFFPHQIIKENPGKPLNEISAEVSDYFYFLAIPGTNKIVVNSSVAASEILNCSKEQKDYFSLLKLKENFDAQLANEHAAVVNQIKNEKKHLIKDSLLSVYLGYYQKEFPRYYKESILGFVRENPDAPASLIELTEYSNHENRDLKLLSFLYDNLTDRMKGLPTAKHIYNLIDKENFGSHLLGKSAPDFTQENPTGKAISLKDFKNHITLLEFWASWCGPCRESNPVLVKIFNKYSPKGFKILGVSLDYNRENWLTAIKDDGLIWEHTSDLKLFKNSIAVSYHITSIPTNYLIDGSGKIIAYNLNEKQLSETLEKLLSDK